MLRAELNLLPDDGNAKAGSPDPSARLPDPEGCDFVVDPRRAAPPARDFPARDPAAEQLLHHPQFQMDRARIGGENRVQRIVV